MDWFSSRASDVFHLFSPLSVSLLLVSPFEVAGPGNLICRSTWQLGGIGLQSNRARDYGHSKLSSRVGICVCVCGWVRGWVDGWITSRVGMKMGMAVVSTKTGSELRRNIYPKHMDSS